MSSSVAEAVTKERLHSSGEDYLKAIWQITLEAWAFSRTTTH